MREAVIVEAVRTPIGRGKLGKGGLSGLHPAQLLAKVQQAVIGRAGIPAKDAHVQKGLAWLKANQRTSGRWFTRSPYRDNKHYITHVGTAFALMALAECGELPKLAAKAK